jgi:hypothetical protein
MERASAAIPGTTEFIAVACGAGDSDWRNLNDDVIANNKKLHQIPGVPLRSTPGSTLPPAPQAENVNIKFAQKMCVLTNQTGLPLHRNPQGDEKWIFSPSVVRPDRARLIECYCSYPLFAASFI